jgi:hypothetical protein
MTPATTATADRNNTVVVKAGLLTGTSRILRRDVEFELVESAPSELGLTDALGVPDALESTELGSQVPVFISDRLRGNADRGILGRDLDTASPR